MADIPRSFKDPAYDALDAATTARLGLPEGLLASIRTRGERSNADQVSEAGAATVYQIIPTTRDAIEKKYGIDAYLSPQNASLAAGYLLQESLKRNGGDLAAAVAEYHGGTNRGAWGPRTKAYINRVMVGLQKPQAPAAGGSTFDRVSASMAPAVPPDMIARVFAAYQGGQMTPDERAEFEADVKAGRVMLPKGASLQGAAPAGGDVLPLPVVQAYWAGKMTPDERAQLEADVAAGAVRLPPGLDLKAGPASQIPVEPGANTTITPDTTTLGQKIVGAGEAALSTVTGMTGGAVGMVGGAAKGLVDAGLAGQLGTQEGVQTVEQAAAGGAGALTYAPRTASGQEQTAAVGGAMQHLIPLAPLAGTLGPAGAAGASARQTATTTRQALQAAVKAKVEEAMVRRAQAGAPAPAGGGAAFGADSVGAARLGAETLRRTLSDELPVPVQLTKGQATRDFEQMRFEGETAKDPIRGQPLRDFAENQNARAIRNFDEFVDQIGAQKVDPVAVGDTVTAALRERMAADKTRIRVAYKSAEKVGAMEDPVNLGGLINHLNEAAPDASTAPLLNTARQWALKLGIAEEKDGVLVPRHEKGPALMNAPPRNVVTLATAEKFRQMINRNTDYEPTNIRQATIIKGLIDQATEGKGGKAYQEARLLRRQFAERYENFGLARDLLNNKRGMSDAIVPAEKVFQKAILSAPMADVKQIGRLLKSSGEPGRQAWSELQGATIRYIRDEATKNVARDSQGNPILSPAALDKAVRQLDSAGKLDYLFGRKGAEQMRAINELAKIIKTTPPGAINHSNTAAVLLAALDMLISVIVSGSSGTLVAIPIATGLRAIVSRVKDRRVQMRINDALGIAPEPEAKVKKPQPVTSPATPAQRLPESRTVH